MIKPRILLAEDHPLVRDALLGLLGELGKVVGAVRDGHALGEAAQCALQHCAPQSKVIILTTYQEPAYLTLAFDAGARGFILKNTALLTELPQALLHVLAGDRYIGLGVKGEWMPVDGGRVPIQLSRT